MTRTETQEVGRPGDGFLAGHSRRAALTAHQQKAGEETMVGRSTDTWRAHGACRTTDPETFFPVAEAGPEFDRAVARAKQVCAGCPVRAECLAWAVEELPHGIAGGMTEDERRTTRLARRARIREVAVARHAPTGTRRPLDARRSPVIEAGQSALAQGVPRDQVATEFGVTRRTVDRWAADQRRSAPTAITGGGR